MIYALCRVALIVISLWPSSVAAEPIKLKFAFVSSDRALLYNGSIKPFVDAVNKEAKGLVEIEVFFSGALGKDLRQQAQMVRDGVADMAYIVPGYSAERFPDNTVLELPGLFRDRREGSKVFARMIEANALKGYEDFEVIAAIIFEPESIHTRWPVASLSDLNGLKIQANNPIQANTLTKLGAKAVLMPANLIAEAMSNATIDGAAMPPAILYEFGVGRLTNYHYMVSTSTTSLALLMNRQKFASLPPQAQKIIRKYGGDWLATYIADFFENVTTKLIAQMSADSKRKVIFPSPSDLEVINAAFRQVKDDWASRSPRNRELLGLVEAEIAKLRSGQ